MNSAYVQHASLNETGSGQKVLFTNLSSQQMHPGSLESFHESQRSAMQEMPFAYSDIPQDHSGVSAVGAESNNVTSLSREETMPSWFRENTPFTNRVLARTPAQRAWGVPEHLIEARANEMF